MERGRGVGEPILVAPKSLPMSDAQVATQVAQWEYNRHTGLRRLLWSCKVFPATPKAECF
jgi:hypothetical protein